MPNSEQHIDQLLANHSFVKWISGNADEIESRRWERWVSQNPDRIHKVREAERFYGALRFEEELPQTISELNRLRKALKGEVVQRKQEKYSNSKGSKKNYWPSVAAVLVLLITVLVVVSNVFWDFTDNTKNKTPVYSTTTTEYGQIRHLTLWDGSRVILNANSTLTYPQTYDGGNLTVSLEGEAYFSIVPGSDEYDRTFTVQTSEGQVTVLGTKFNVNTRSEETAVVLEEGKVHLEVSDTLSAVKSSYYYTMKPGERALLSPQRKGIGVQAIDTELYTSWRNLELKFNNTPLEQIARRISQTYGVKVEFKEKDLKDVEFSGTVTNKNFAVLLQGLRALLNVPITHNNNTITFGR